MKNRVSVLAIIIIFALACNACNRHEMMSNTGQQNSGMDQMMNNPEMMRQMMDRMMTDSKMIEMMSAQRDVVIVTGSSGLISSAMVNRFAESFRVIGFDAAGPPRPPRATECAWYQEK